MSVLAPGFLVAAPPLGDPNFDRSVVLLAAHGADGAFGWVINGRVLMTLEEMLKRAAIEQAWAHSQALAIVEQTAPGREPETAAGLGIYFGLIGSVILVLFGLTIVVKRVSRPYAEPEDDDI